MALTAWHLRPHADAFAEVVSRLHCAQNMSKDTGKDKARYYACMQALRYINALRKAGSLPYEELKGLMITTSDDGSLFTNMSTAIVHARSALMQTARFADLPNGYTFRIVVGVNEHAQHFDELKRIFRSQGRLYPDATLEFWKDTLKDGVSIIVTTKARNVAAAHMKMFRLDGGDIGAYVNLIASQNASSHPLRPSTRKPSMFILSCIHAMLQEMTRRGTPVLSPFPHTSLHNSLSHTRAGGTAHILTQSVGYRYRFFKGEMFLLPEKDGDTIPAQKFWLKQLVRNDLANFFGAQLVLNDEAFAEQDCAFRSACSRRTPLALWRAGTSSSPLRARARHADALPRRFLHRSVRCI